MYTILEKRVLAENIYLMRIHAPRVARAAKPGQFIIVRIDEFGERVPLTISDYDAEQGSVTIVTQAIGASTRKLCALEQGDALADFVGPLGHPSEFIHEDLDTLRKKRFLFVAGGVGTAPVYPQVKWLHEHGVKADVIIGAKTKSMLIYTEEMARVADNLYIATDDGSEGFKGMVTALIKDLIDNRGKQYDVCVAIGPMIMMKFVTLTTKEYSLPTVVSLNTLMVDGTGMCGACRVTVGGKTVFTCVDGPGRGFGIDTRPRLHVYILILIEQVGVDVLHHVGANLVRLVDAAFDLQRLDRIDPGITDNVFQVPLHRIHPVLHIEQVVDRSLRIGIRKLMIHVVVTMVIVDRLGEYFIRILSKHSLSFLFCNYPRKRLSLQKIGYIQSRFEQVRLADRLSLSLHTKIKQR